MTARERAIEWVGKTPLHWTEDAEPDIIANGNEVIRTVEAAILEEREACAKIADEALIYAQEFGPDPEYSCATIIKAIRKRGQ